MKRRTPRCFFVGFIIVSSLSIPSLSIAVRRSGFFGLKGESSEMGCFRPSFGLSASRLFLDFWSGVEVFGLQTLQIHSITNCTRVENVKYSSIGYIINF